MHQGSCLCGAVRVELLGAITDIIHFHCSLCRKNSGTAYATNGFISTSEFNVEDPSNKLAFYEFKAGKRRHFCTVCASPIFTNGACTSAVDPVPHPNSKTCMSDLKYL
jgi:hypothetical protein